MAGCTDYEAKMKLGYKALQGNKKARNTLLKAYIFGETCECVDPPRIATGKARVSYERCSRKRN